jgi:adenylylsulfate kinase
MIVETRIRSFVKALSWRVTATITTIMVALAITKRIDIAVQIGLLEAILKMFVYFIHERSWAKIRFGIHEKKPLVLWFTGLSGCGKSQISQAVYEKFQQRRIRVEYFNGRKIREIFPEIGYSPENRKEHIRKIGLLIGILENNNTSVIGSFESPFEETRNYLRQNLINYIEIYVHASRDYCMSKDSRGLYTKAMTGELDDFVGVSIDYEEPKNPEIIIEAESQSVSEATKQVLNYLEKNNFL